MINVEVVGRFATLILPEGSSRLATATLWFLRRTTAGRFVASEKWRDEATGNLVDLFEMKADGKTSCHVMYEPLQQSNAGGF